MFKFLVFFISLCSIFVEGRLQVPFTGALQDSVWVKINFDLGIGTPEQKINVELQPNFLLTYRFSLYVLNKAKFNRGFDSSKSSTFAKIQDISTNYGNAINATETIRIGTSTVKAKTMLLMNEDVVTSIKKDALMGIDRYYYTYDSYFECKLIDPNAKPFNTSDNCTTFTQSVARDYPDQGLLLAFDKFDGDLKKNFTGQLVFGDKAKDLCSGDWAFLPEIHVDYNYDRQWTFNVASISVDKYSWKNPKGPAYFDLTQNDIVLPYSIFFSALKGLGSTDSHSVSCDSKTDIVLNLGGKELRIKPASYVKKITDTYCVFNGQSSFSDDEHFKFPVSVLSEHCIYFDYKSIGVGFTSRV